MAFWPKTVLPQIQRDITIPRPADRSGVFLYNKLDFEFSVV